MQYPKLKPLLCRRQTVDVFGGYNRNAVIGAGEFSDMQNLTSDLYPVLSVRAGRSFYRRPASPQGLIAKDEICYVDGADFVAGDTVVPMGLSVAAQDCPKQLVSMGTYVIILPDKKYINTRDLTDFGNIEAVFTAQGVRVEKAQEEGFLRICASGIGRDFRAGDAVKLTGFSASGLDGSVVLKAREEDYLLVAGQLEETVEEPDAVTVSRRMPRLDFAVESGNRLWGCRYGQDENGNFLNEIYASALGDFRNWNCFEGLATDSYAASCGTDGVFTGAVSYLGSPLFFKENCVHKVYGSYPAAFRIQDTACRGVEEGSDRSIVLVNETLFYKSRGGICAYDGSLPVCVSDCLGTELFTDAAAGGAHGKYYVSMKGAAGYSLFVFDTGRLLWHREDNLHASHFCTHQGQLYALDAANRDILQLTGGAEEERVLWMAQSGDLGLERPDMKHISRIRVRLALEQGAKVVISASYDGAPEWEELCTVFGTSLRSFEIPLHPRRCDTLRLRFEGEGQARIYSVTKYIRQGSDAGAAGG